MNTNLTVYDATVSNTRNSSIASDEFYHVVYLKEACTTKESVLTRIYCYPSRNISSIFTQECKMSKSTLDSIRGHNVAIIVSNNNYWI